MRKTVILFFIFGLIIGNSLYGQSTQTEISAKLFFTGGYHFLDMSELNSDLSTHNYPTVNNQLISLGADYQIYDDTIVRDIELMWFLRSKASANNYNSSVGGYMYLFNLGYLVVNTGKIHLYPLIGLGLGGMSLVITEEGTPTFDDMLAGSPQNLVIRKTGLIINAGLGLDFIIGGDKGKPEFIIGLRGGYIYYPSNNDWNANSVTVSSGPSTGLSGAYVRIMIGIGDMETTQ